MTDAPYVPFYTSDFLAGTSGMTSASKGVYITLLCLMYEAEGPLPQKWDTLARRCGCTLPAFKKAISDLQDDAKVVVSDAGIWSEKCDKHIAQRCERRSSAKAAAEKRWEKTKQKQGGVDATASIPQCQPEPEPEPYKEKDTNVSQKCADQIPVARPKTPPKAHLPPDWVPGTVATEYALSQQLNDSEIEEMADEFQSYWSERGDAKARKSERGWLLCWQGHVRRNAATYIRNRRLAEQQQMRFGQSGGSVASIVARRRVCG